MTNGFRPSRLLLVVTATVALAGCKTTYDETLATSDTVAVSTTTTLPIGTAVELLPRLATEAAGLSAVMIAGGNAGEVVERVDDLWTAARPQVAKDKPELLGDFDANVARLATAVQYKRAADADKAAANLAVLADFYTQ